MQDAKPNGPFGQLSAFLNGRCGRTIRGLLVLSIISIIATAAVAQTYPESETSPWDTGAPAGSIGPNWVCALGGAPVTGYDLLLLLAIAVALAILAVLLYRLTLEDLIRRGLRPAMLSSTVANLAIGAWLLAAFAVIPDVLGLCWFAIIGALFLLWLIILLLMRRVLLGAVIAFLLLAVAIIAVQQLILT